MDIEKFTDTNNGLAKQVYEDSLKPSVVEIGQILSFLPRSLRAFLSSWECWIINREQKIKHVTDLVESKLLKYNNEEISYPEPYITVPTLQAISYCIEKEDLVNMFANLLVSSMIKDKKWKVHPSFIEILKQINPDEAKLLKSLKEISYPLLELRLYKNIRNDVCQIVLNNFSDIAYGVCEFPENIIVYLENLERLKIIKIENDQLVGCEERINSILNCDFVKKIIDKYAKSGQLRPIKKRFDITSFGQNFIEMCVMN